MHLSIKQFYSPEEITKRFRQFGGIMHYIFPRSKIILEDFEREQKQAVSRTSLFTFVTSDNVEKRDDMNENISHHLLHYEVEPHITLG